MLFTDAEDLKREAIQKTQEALFKEQKIKEEEHRLAVEDFMEKQRDFFEVLEERTKVAQENANNSLVGVDSGITPKAFIAELLNEEKRTNNFSNVIVFTRSAKGSI